MKPLIRILDRVLTPVLILTYVALCVLLLAVTEQKAALPILLSMFWAGVMMAALRWGVWGILKGSLRKGKASRKSVLLLTRFTELLLLLLTGAALWLSLFLWEIPSVWLLIPAFLFGFRGAVRFDAEFL